MAALRAIFARRSLATLLLAYQAFFLNVLLPGHTRGAITLDSRHAARSCCCCEPGGDAAAAKEKGVPTQRDREHCAVCDFAAHLTPPDTFVVRLDPFGLVDRLPPPPPAVAAAIDRIGTYLATGPPASLA